MHELAFCILSKTLLLVVIPTRLVVNGCTVIFKLYNSFKCSHLFAAISHVTFSLICQSGICGMLSKYNSEET